jgi:RNA polymerase sigma-70 factor (ECF subfamily)
MHVNHEGESQELEIARLDAAKSGDDNAFAALTQPFRRELHVHCYRMLGSFDDADDALQETLIRAWRQLDKFEPRAPFRAWLYRIATNVSLTMLATRARRGELPDSKLFAQRGALRLEGEPVHLDPYPDRLLDEITLSELGPEATVELHESVKLAFVAAVQFLPPLQRAALLLRDVIGYPAAEVADMLSTTVAAANSALQRARASLEQQRSMGQVARGHCDAGTEIEQSLVRRLVDAWHAVDIPSIVALLKEDALLTMPPQPVRFVGRDTIGAFFATVPGGGHLERFRLVSTRANRQPAVAGYYRPGDSGVFHAYSILVLSIEDDAIASLARFANADLFPHFGLPATIDG